MAESKQIGFFGACAIGIGGMVGGGIFAVLGEAVELAHGGTAFAFAVAGVLALLTAYAYARLSVAYPSSGGTVVFLHRAFGADLATGSLNAMLWLSYLVTLALYAVAFGAYALPFFGDEAAPWLKNVFISVGILLPVGINLLNADIVSKSELAIVVLKLTLLFVVIIAGLGTADTSKLAPSTWEGFGPLLVAGLVIFVAYEGFELIANSAADIQDPKRTLPRAFLFTVVFVTVLYILVAIVTVGSLPPERIAAAQDYALAEAAKPALGHVGFVCVSISALLATFSAINATIYGSARLGFTLARDREMPPVLARKVWHRPVVGVFAVGGISLLLANLVDLTEIATLASAGFLLVFAAVNASACKLGPTIGANRLVTGFGALACLGALIVLLVHSAQSSPIAVWMFAGFVALAVGFELVLTHVLGRPIALDDA